MSVIAISRGSLSAARKLAEEDLPNLAQLTQAVASFSTAWK